MYVFEHLEFSNQKFQEWLIFYLKTNYLFSIFAHWIGSGDESDAEMNEWENQQIRKGVTGAQVLDWIKLKLQRFEW